MEGPAGGEEEASLRKGSEGGEAAEAAWWDKAEGGEAEAARAGVQEQKAQVTRAALASALLGEISIGEKSPQ